MPTDTIQWVQRSRFSHNVVHDLFGFTPAERYVQQRSKGHEKAEHAGESVVYRDHGYVDLLHHFRGTVGLAQYIEYYFAITGLGLGEHIVSLMLLPLKMVLAPQRIEVRDMITLALMGICIATFSVCGVYTTQLYSYLYHAVRRTSFIKLVMIFSIVDVADKVLSSLCQDTLEVLYACVLERWNDWKRRTVGVMGNEDAPGRQDLPPPPAPHDTELTGVSHLKQEGNDDGAVGPTVNGSRSRRHSQLRRLRCKPRLQREVTPNSSLPRYVKPHSLVLLISSVVAACVSLALHSLVLLLSVVTLNVAIDAEGNSLVALLVSNNFNELKSVIFKKQTSESLHGVCALDALERMQNIIFLIVMMLHHLHERVDETALYDVMIILGVEVVIDFIKHRFISKFNGISPTVFQSYSQLTLLDIASEKLFWRLPGLHVRVCGPTKDPVAVGTGHAKDGDETHVSPRLLAPSNGFAPKNVKRIGLNGIPYAALVLWSFSRVGGYLLIHLPVVLGLVILVVVLIKCVLSALVSGVSTRFILRSVIASAPASGGDTPGSAMGSQGAGRDRVDAPRPSVTGNATGAIEVRLSPLLLSLLKTDRFDLQAGKAKK